ncbi:hypothetical protein AB0G71_09000 [Streptomyces sp. NPDC020403]|uniref:hypothetical protein n=1 Tax=unclassified Streptomyces TaxID=2593676 RepID=UPI0034087775
MATQLRCDDCPTPPGQSSESGDGELLGEFVGCFGEEVGELVAALLAEHVFGAVEAVGGADGEVLADEGAGAAVLAGDGVVGVAEELEGCLQPLEEARAEVAEDRAWAVGVFGGAGRWGR